MATQFNRPPLRRITDFKSKLVGGGARPNLFEVELAFPEEIAIDNDVKDKARFLVKAAALTKNLALSFTSLSIAISSGKASSTSNRFGLAPPPTNLLLKSVIRLKGGLLN